jgi:hypothetical protein
MKSDISREGSIENLAWAFNLLSLRTSESSSVIGTNLIFERFIGPDTNNYYADPVSVTDISYFLIKLSYCLTNRDC